MTQEEYENLRQGDVIQSSKTGVIYCIVDGDYSRLLEQKTKREIKNHYEKYKVIIKAVA